MMEHLFDILINRSDCGSKERQFELFHANTLMECDLLKNMHAHLFNFVDNATHINGEFIVMLHSNVQLEIFGLPLHRNIRFSDICISEPFCQKVTYRVNNLPPISMDFFLPSSYPGDTNFFFTLNCSWLPENLMERLNVIVNQQITEFSDQMALENCCQFLQDKTLLELLKLGAFPLDIAKVFPDDQYNPYLITEMLINYEEEHRDIEFQSKIYECSICMNELSGIDCIQLRECGHVICRNCAGNQFALQVRDSARGGAPTCPECDETVRQQDIQDVVSDEVYADYERRLLNKTLSSMPDIIACPNKDCSVEHVSLVEDLSQGTCPQCRFQFCARCKAAFHEDTACQTGPLANLKPAEIAELLDRYSGAGADGKENLEMQYGKANLDKLKDEHLCYKVIAKECKRCPNCDSPIIKNDGCNRMNCSSCKKNFCWLCLKVLDDKTPYIHFGKGCILFPGG